MAWAQGVAGSNPVAPTISSLLRPLEMISVSKRIEVRTSALDAGDLSGAGLTYIKVEHPWAELPRAQISFRSRCF
jgi:hypothetical protein